MTGPRRRAILAVPAVLVVAVVAIFLVRGDRESAVLASGTVEATEAALGFQVPGMIDSIAVREGDRVAGGQVLAWLDRRELEARRRAAEAQVAAARARLRELESGFRSEEVEQGRAALRAAARRLVEAEREHQRNQRLHEGGAISRRQLDAAETALTVAQAERDRAAETLAVLERGPRVEQIAAQRALTAQAEAGLGQLDALLDQTIITAPFGGLVTARNREPGEIVGAGAPVLTLTDLNDRWIRIYVREDEVGRIAVGQEAWITADAYPDRRYAGQVVHIANEAEFTPRNVQTAAERVKLVYRVKVRVLQDPTWDLKPGLPADVRLDVVPR
jgi:HlyD family secretion protein